MSLFPKTKIWTQEAIDVGPLTNVKSCIFAILCKITTDYVSSLKLSSYNPRWIVEFLLNKL